jgi:hypothetical protein
MQSADRSVLKMDRVKSKILVQRCQESLRQIVLEAKQVEEFKYPVKVLPSRQPAMSLNPSLFDLGESINGLSMLDGLETEEKEDRPSLQVTKNDEFESSLRPLTSLATNLPLNHPPPSNSDTSFTEEVLSEEFGIDMEEQRRLMQGFEEQKRASETSKMVAPATQMFEEDEKGATEYHDPLPESEQEIIDLAPGVQLPLINSFNTWQAIREGRILVTQCYCCLLDLTCMEDADYLACADCWVFSPIDHQKCGLVGDNYGGGGVCIGVKTEDINTWLLQQH